MRASRALKGQTDRLIAEALIAGALIAGALDGLKFPDNYESEDRPLAAGIAGHAGNERREHIRPARDIFLDMLARDTAAQLNHICLLYTSPSPRD